MFPFASLISAAQTFAAAPVQTAGAITGGTAIVVNATGIVGTPSASIGSVSGVTPTSFTWTTPDLSSSGPGLYVVTFTNGDLQSSSFEYTALPSPVVNAITPSSGSGTMPTTGLVFGISGLPPEGSATPISITVGTGTVSNMTPLGPGAIKGDLSPPGVGALTCVAVIDGIASPPASVYTGT